MIPKGLGFPSTSAHPAGMTPEEYARRRLLLAQRGGLFRGPIPTQNAASVWRAFSSNLSNDAQQHGYQNPLQWMQDSAKAGQAVNGPRFLGGAIQQPPQQMSQAGGYTQGPPAMHAPPPTPMQGFMAAENPAIKQMLAQALAQISQNTLQSQPMQPYTGTPPLSRTTGLAQY